MSVTQINGGTQIRSGTITTTQLAASAGIVDTQLAASYLYANGTRAMTGNLQGGGNEATNFATPTGSGSLATKGYVDGIAQGMSAKYSARAASTGAETYTIASGAVTTISGTTLDSVAPIIGEYILVKDAPAASGAGSVGSNQPANGIYQVTGNTTNLSVTRATDMTGTISPAGSFVFIESGATNAASGWVVTTPNTSAAFTYGTGTISWTQFSGAGEITVDSTLVKTGNQLTRAAITGNVTIASGSNSAVIPSSTVTVAMINATGSPTSTTYFSGSGVWSTPSTTPGAGTVTFAMLNSGAYVTSSTGITSGSTDTTVATAKAVYAYVTSAMAGAGAGTVTTVSVVSANGFAGSVANASSTPAITISTSITGLLKGNGTAISAATAGTDYVVPGTFIVRETPSGTTNGSTTNFGLANTPVSGTEQVFLNGILQDSGAGNDYTISGATITFLSAPASGDKVRVNYHK